MYKTSTQLQDDLSINNGVEPITDWSYPSKIAKKLVISNIKTVDASSKPSKIKVSIKMDSLNASFDVPSS
jgi:hypothetical protein